MSNTINAGKLSDVGKIFKNISNALSKGINKLFDLGVKILDPENEDGQISYTISLPGGQSAKVIFTPSSKDSAKWDISVTDDKSKQTKKYTDVKDADVDKIITKAVKELYDVDLSEINSSKHISAVFRKVCAAKSDTVELVSVDANYDATEVWDDINAIVSDDAFVAALPADTESGYSIVDEGDTFDVQPTSSIDKAIIAAYQIDEIVSKALNLYLSLLYIMPSASGSNVTDIQDVCRKLEWPVRDVLSIISEYSQEQIGYVPNFAALVNTSLTVNMDNVLAYIREKITELVCVLQLYYCNMTHDFQPSVDGWIRDLSRIAEYDLKQRLCL